ncbi:hypothetical protein M0R45_007106 [Rubus argutus]|uniref:Uncharacterized protein n=1 Tax=Rubus argutus TaxID=59490 RepID=A0AAW1YU05_RUBAR
MMETSLSKFGMILDSVQSDVMQVKKGTKEVSREMEAIQQKLMVQDSSLQLMNKGQEDFKTSFDAGIKSMLEQLSKNPNQDKLQEMFLVLSALPEKIEASLLSSQNSCTTPSSRKCRNCFALSKHARIRLPPSKHAKRYPYFHQRKYVRKYKVSSLASPKGDAFHAIPHQKPHLINKASERLRNLALDSHSTVPPKVCVQAAVVPTTETGGWKTVKAGKATSIDRVPQKVQKHNGITCVQQERESRVIIESDEDIDGDIKNYMIEEVNQETERILRRARRRKRKCCNPIIIN